MARACQQCGATYDDEIGFCPEDGSRLPPPHDESEDASEQEPVALGRDSDDDEDTVDEEGGLVGRSIGSYRVGRLLGKGGMGGVYLGEHPVIGSKVAIKFLHPRFAGDKKIIDRFFNEARAVNVIGHDNILKILDLNVTEDGLHYFVMEFLQGKSLQSLVEAGPVPLSVAGPILTQFCEALQAAHDRRIYHRDIKPDNVYLVAHKGRKNFVKVVDFGVAKLSDGVGGPGSTGKTQTGMVIGTPAYMSPEQAGGVTDKIDGRSDIYSAGVMMFQLATGKLPFAGTSFGEVLIGHLQLEPPDPRSLNPEVSEQYAQVILKALKKKQIDRYQSMRELSAAILASMEALAIPNELPHADGEEKSSTGASSHVTPGFAGTPQPNKAKQIPRFGAAEVVPKPKAPPKRSGQTLSTRMERKETIAQQDPGVRRRPQRAHPGLWIGLGGAAIALLTVLAMLLLHTRSEDDDAQTRRVAAKEARAAIEAVERERALEREGDLQLQPLLSVLSDPPEAMVEVTWPEGQRKEKTPFQLKVPRNSKVRFTFTLKGYLTYVHDVLADEAQVVKAELVRDRGRAESRNPSKTPRKPKGKQASGDDVIDVGDDIFDK